MEVQEDLFVIADAADLEMAFAKALKEHSKKIVMVIPVWNEQKFFDIHSAIHGDLISVSRDGCSCLSRWR